MAGLSLSGVGKVYDDGTRAVKDLTVDVADGQLRIGDRMVNAFQRYFVQGMMAGSVT